MRGIRRALVRAVAAFGRGEYADEDMRAELEAHLEMAIEENLRRGMSPREARRQALLAAGGLTQAAERVRAQRGLPWLESLAADVRYAVRHFRRTPLATLTIVLVLSLGIGTNVVLFTVLNSIVTLPAPGIARDESLVRIRGTMRLERIQGIHARLLSWPEVQEYAGRGDVFSSVAAHADESVAVQLDGAASAPVTAHVVFVTPNYFRVLGVRPALGSEPAADGDATRPEGSPGALISYALWQQRFGGAGDVLGRVVRINEVPVEIVGVAPPRFLGTGGNRALMLWVPLAAYPQIQKRTAAVFTAPDSLFLSAAARLRPGVTSAAATTVAAGIAERLFQARDGATTPRRARTDVARGRSERGSADVVPMLASNERASTGEDLLVSAAAATAFALLVLLVTSTNVSALMVGLAAARRREIGVRLSLGAPRARLIRQLLTESVLLAAVAAAVGLFATALGIRLLGTTLEDMQLVVNWRVTLATCAVAVIAGILFGLSPALHATRVSVGAVLKSSASSLAGARSRLQRGLVVAQIALTQPLLVGLGVVIATLVTDLGAAAKSGAADRIVEVELDTWAGRVALAEQASRITAIVQRVAAMPGVVAALPMQMGTMTVPLTVHAADRVDGIAYDAVMEAGLVAAPRGYFETFEIPFVRGRDFDAGEHVPAAHDLSRPAGYRVAIIGSDLARRLWGDADPLGRRLEVAVSQRADTAAMVVVGVVAENAAGTSDGRDRIRVYVPYALMNAGVIARTAGPALPMLESIRSVVAAEAPQTPISGVHTMAQREEKFRRDVLRASGAVAGGGLLALLLSAIGLYAVVSFAVTQRTREIGIRTALGATQGPVVRMFFIQGLALGALGLILGLPLSMIVIRLITSALNWPLASPPLLGVAIGAVVLAVAAAAAWIPARRASGVDPLVALRAE